MSDCSNWRGDRIKAAVERQFRERTRPGFYFVLCVRGSRP